MNEKVLALLVLGSCHSVRDVVFCKVHLGDTIDQSVVQCAQNEKRYTKPLAELEGWYATDEAGLRKIADKLASCQNNAKE